jgi:methionine-gamma-lyase
VDNTFASPIRRRPLEHGAHVSLSSATKFLGGHNNLMAGVAAGEAVSIEVARQSLVWVGVMLDPFAAWLAVRGIKTVHLRVERVHAPGLAGHALLPHGAGGMFSFALRGGQEETNPFIRGLK